MVSSPETSLLATGEWMYGFACFARGTRAVPEANVARRLVEGHSVGEIAAANSLSRETIRRQLKPVLEKTGKDRQNWWAF